MAQPQPQAERVAGVVEATNPKGVRVAGQWWNYSQYHADVLHPERGQTVELALGKGGFIRQVTLVDGATGPRGPVSQSTATRERTIARLAVLKAAAAYCASRPDAKAADVLKIASAWEAWVLREEPTSAEGER